MGTRVSKRGKYGPGRTDRLLELSTGYDEARTTYSGDTYGIRRTAESATRSEFNNNKRKTERLHQTAPGYVAQQP